MSIPKIDNVVVKIVRAIESSGNIQFFLRATRIDDTQQLFGNNLEYQCFETLRHDLSEDECVDYALFGAIFLLEFFGHDREDLKFHGFTEENMKAVEASKRFWR